VSKALRSRVSFAQVNLNEPLPALGKFDVVFLRNVMIYFNNETKRQVVARVLETIRPGGYFLIGHSESLNDITTKVEQVAPSSYRKP
jgi:chemotaxis protein methyltransferase CheR